MPAELVYRQSIRPNGTRRIKAAETVLNRSIGLPAQPIDVKVQRVLAKKLCKCTIDELRAFARAACQDRPQKP